jgi:hypothetical protein
VSGQVNIKYWRAPMRLLKWVGSATGDTDSVETLAYVSTGVKTGFAVHHASSLKNIESKLTLNEEEHVCLMLYRDSQKMMEESEILHGEFLLEGRYGLLQKCYAGGGEDNVTNVKQQIYRICAAPKDD